MIFSPDLARAVDRGEKSQTRRPVKRHRLNGLILDKPCRYKPGRIYAVQPGRGQRAICHINVLAVHREPVGTITDRDAKAEGFATRAQFANRWLELYEPKGTWPPTEQIDCPHCDDEHVVWDWTAREWVECPHCDMGVITRPATPDDTEILARFERHAHTTVWVITFERATRRFLAAHSPLNPPTQRFRSARHVTPRPVTAQDEQRRREALTDDEARGYTTNPSRAPADEPEPVDPAELDNAWITAADAKRREAKHDKARIQQRSRELLTVEERMIAAHRAASLNHVDTSSETFLLRRSLARNASDVTVLRRLETVERKAHREAA